MIIMALNNALINICLYDSTAQIPGDPLAALQQARIQGLHLTPNVEHSPWVLWDFVRAGYEISTEHSHTIEASGTTGVYVSVADQMEAIKQRALRFDPTPANERE